MLLICTGLQFLASIRGDIANVTAPPFFLAPQSFLEGLKCFTERPSLFSAPASEADPARRAMLVVKWWLASLKSAFYVGQDGKAGIRKPLNPFLGELWFGDWSDDKTTTGIIVEQVRYVYSIRVRSLEMHQADKSVIIRRSQHAICMMKPMAFE